ncbi:type II toxin-antitoxin system VapC family toxin [Shinella sp.]|uniref:type II toxin-antitoxin system VapC family toxin n=1 Tax=Shinella sp. TaxID=1870904 RepID=UPI00258EED9F|nr:type II toxin-antitoxin system VapC family toxin [Shinella sp.]MCW5707530.1 type II toxin-antitoxin system VapC family toxin [Shinella sp.]
MFVDASAFVAILASEEGADALLARLQQADIRYTSPMAVWETSLALARERQIAPTDALQLVTDFLTLLSIAVEPIDRRVGDLAVIVHQRFGKGRHPASLNFGDCFAYACARQFDVPLLYKGDDFPQTDIETA